MTKGIVDGFKAVHIQRQEPSAMRLDVCALFQQIVAGIQKCPPPHHTGQRVPAAQELPIGHIAIDRQQQVGYQHDQRHRSRHKPDLQMQQFAADDIGHGNLMLARLNTVPIRAASPAPNAYHRKGVCLKRDARGFAFIFDPCFVLFIRPSFYSITAFYPLHGKAFVFCTQKEEHRSSLLVRQ